MKKPRKKTNFWENIGKLLLDFCKLVFGAIFLGGILRIGIPHDTLILAGFIFAFISGIFGIVLTTKEKENKYE